MAYQKFKGMSFFKKINTEEKARNLIWAAKFGGKEFICSQCNSEDYYQLHTEPEIRQCKHCRHHTRLRVGTIFSKSKLPLLTWVRGIYLAMQGKRGISALELQSRLGLGSYRTAWRMLHKIRRSLQQRDGLYKLNKIIELDGTGFGNKAKDNQKTVLVAIETKEWTDSKGRKKTKAGFAKVVVADETKENAQEFLEKNVSKDTMVNTDAGKGLIHIEGYDHDYQIMDSKRENIDRWLPWVHRFISNAKTWLIGTHHGVRKKYLELYLAEYTYRFNRRHDPDSLFHIALTACTQADPVTNAMLCYAMCITISF